MCLPHSMWTKYTTVYNSYCSWWFIVIRLIWTLRKNPWITMNMNMRTYEFPWIWISTPWIIMTMNMTIKWISKSMNLYEYEYDVHEPYDYEKVHEYDTYDYESLWAVWTKIVKSMNLYEYEYETSWIWTIWLWITMSCMNRICQVYNFLWISIWISWLWIRSWAIGYELPWTVWGKFQRRQDFSWIWLMQCFL